jgi:antitoxin (DNA-binding transcriptional repressor) of toxin-antitoxin stability system
LRILERDTPVADLVPIEQDAGGVDDDVHLAQLERKGVIRRGSAGALPAELFERGPGDSSGTVRAALISERR